MKFPTAAKLFLACRARRVARSRGLEGVRWPKMVGPAGRESTGGNPLIIWNQPQVIHLAELLYQSSPDDATLQRYAQMVEETAQGLSSMLAGYWETGGENGQWNVRVEGLKPITGSPGSEHESN